MYRIVKASTSADKITGKTWPEFIANIESQTKFKVDSAYRKKYWSDIIDLLDGSDVYEAEVTKYSDGTYELLMYNISGPYGHEDY